MIGAFTKDEMLAIVAGQAEAGNALVVAGLVEDSLEKLLLAAGRELSNTEAERVFAGMGPLASFSAKIEIAYLFDLLDKAVRDDLRACYRDRAFECVTLIMGKVDRFMYVKALKEVPVVSMDETEE